jgi:hypothetical protein
MGSAIPTNDSILSQIATSDGLASSVDAQFAALGSAVPKATAAAWSARLASYRAWADITRTAFSGGLWERAWFGHHAAQEQGDRWAAELGTGGKGPDGVHVDGWQTIANAIAKGQAPPSIAAGSPPPQDPTLLPRIVPDGTFELDTSTKLLIGLGVAVVGVAVLKH